MPLGNNVWVRATPETVFGVFDSTRVAAEALWFRLFGNTAFGMQVDPKYKALMSADGQNKPTTNIFNRYGVAGKLRTPVYPTQALALLNFATTLASGDSASYTFDFFDSVNVERYLGTKVPQIDLACAAETDEGVLYADLTLLAQAQGTPPTLTQPAVTVFPAETPYAHQDNSTGFSVGGSARSKYNSFKASVTNTLIASFEELSTISNLTWAGRQVTFGADFQYTATADRTVYEAQTQQAASIVFTRGAHVLTLDFKGKTTITKRTRQLPVGSISRQQIEFLAFIDNTPGTDFSFTAT